MKTCILLLACLIFLSCSKDEDYNLPPEVPEEVQADGFRQVREDIALLYSTACHEEMNAGGIRINEAKYFELADGYALLLTGNYPNGDILQCAIVDGSISTSEAIFPVTCDLQLDYLYCLPYGDGFLSCQLSNGRLTIGIVGESEVLIWGSNKPWNIGEQTPSDS